eukprot:CAMPEP_0197012504 /NCGR_PEP_ID=MMETSP1380-20130617/62708_1 /TAXON_ID=5936 /ORGANISM="Euplotes crassus, Strain CT5" /LENGTH=54 /DNA_ID=CAMNT_0042436019 /DNA_START=225 /DNA_END=389 /DNA_ORIENTATION=-
MAPTEKTDAAQVMKNIIWINTLPAESLSPPFSLLLVAKTIKVAMEISLTINFML